MSFASGVHRSAPARPPRGSRRGRAAASHPSTQLWQAGVRNGRKRAWVQGRGRRAVEASARRAGRFYTVGTVWSGPKGPRPNRIRPFSLGPVALDALVARLAHLSGPARTLPHAPWRRRQDRPDGAAPVPRHRGAGVRGDRRPRPLPALRRAGAPLHRLPPAVPRGRGVARRPRWARGPERLCLRLGYPPEELFPPAPLRPGLVGARPRGRPRRGDRRLPGRIPGLRRPRRPRARGRSRRPPGAPSDRASCSTTWSGTASPSSGTIPAGCGAPSSPPCPWWTTSSR